MSIRNGLKGTVSLLLLCGGMLLVGCGGDDDTEPADGASDPSVSDDGAAGDDGDENATTDEDDGAAGEGEAGEDMSSSSAGMDDASSDDDSPPDDGKIADTEPLFGESETRNRVAAGEICDRIATIECAGEARCCNDPGREFSACKQTMKQGCVDALHLDYMSLQPVTGFDPDRAEAALARYEDMAKACDPLVATVGEDPDGLRGMLQGTLEPDGDCFPLSLAGPFDVTEEQGAAYLAACKDPENYACLPVELLEWTCVERGDVGDPCFTDLNCQPGLYCPQQDPLVPEVGGGPCAPTLDTGEACLAANECTSLACVHGKCAETGDVQAAFCLRGAEVVGQMASE